VKTRLIIAIAGITVIASAIMIWGCSSSKQDISQKPAEQPRPAAAEQSATASQPAQTSDLLSTSTATPVAPPVGEPKDVGVDMEKLNHLHAGFTTKPSSDSSIQNDNVYIPRSESAYKLNSAPEQGRHFYYNAVRAGSAKLPERAGRDAMLSREDDYRVMWGESSDVDGDRAKMVAALRDADEVWIISKYQGQAQPDAQRPGCGALMAKMPDEEKEVPVPLKHTDVQAEVAGYIATVDVTQQFHNPYDTKIEAVYVFPLPENAAVSEFIMTVGDRKIRGIIREREEAEKIYTEARNQGYVASLLTQERPNVFTQKVANIEPGKAIDINIKYFSTLAYVDGWYEFVFPMVVGPRFNPPGYTEGVGAVARGQQGISGQKTEVQYLRPNERSGHDISLAVALDAGVSIEELKCATHVTKVRKVSDSQRKVVLADLDSIPNKDFILRYRVAGRVIKSALMTHRDERGGFFTFMLYPPENLADVTRSPMEMIFVLDCSGSMNGEPIARSKEAIRRALRKLQPGDSFQIIRFSNNASQLGPKPVEATPENIRKGLEYVDSLEGSGGTMMIEGIKAALDFEHDPERFRLVSFLTDGYIGNEDQILRAIHEKLGASRIFSFGVGSSVNRYLLDSMAKIGKGAVAYIGLNENAGEVIDLFYERISHPALADVKLDFGSMQASDVYPGRLPDLFVGRPVIVTGRFSGHGTTDLRITGTVAGKPAEYVVAVNLDDAEAEHKGIACVWARKKIEVLSGEPMFADAAAAAKEIKDVALEYGLMSAYTAFVAVDSSERTQGESGVTVVVPVPVPEGVKYETTVSEAPTSEKPHGL